MELGLAQDRGAHSTDGFVRDLREAIDGVEESIFGSMSEEIFRDNTVIRSAEGIWRLG